MCACINRRTFRVLQGVVDVHDAKPRSAEFSNGEYLPADVRTERGTSASTHATTTDVSGVAYEPRAEAYTTGAQYQSSGRGAQQQPLQISTAPHTR